MYKVLITGGAGFIGNHLVELLLSKNYEVSVIDDFSKSDRKNLSKEVQLIEKDILSDFSSLFEKEKFDFVVHLAAQNGIKESYLDPLRDAEVNLIGSINLMGLAARYKVKKFILLTDASLVYSETETNFFSEQDPILYHSPNGIARNAVENYLDLFNQHYGLKSVILRYTNLFGGRERSGSESEVTKLINSAFLGERLVVNQTSRPDLEFLYVKELAEAILFSIESKNLEGTYHVASEERVRLIDLVSLIKKITKLSLTVDYVNGKNISGNLLFLDSTKLRKAGWKPKYSLERGVSETFDWIRLH